MPKHIDKFHLSLKSRGKGTKNWANSWSEVEYLGVDKQGRDKFAASITVGHRVFKDRTDGQWKKHKLTDERSTKDYVLIQSAKCCVEVYPYYAKYFDVYHEEVRLHEERWVVQRLFKEPVTWRDVDVYNPVTVVEEAADFITVTITYDSDYGSLVVKYIQRDGQALKHEVVFTNTADGTETFRVLQQWAGIVAAKVKHDKGEDIITKPKTVSSSKFGFLKEDGSFSIHENQWDMVEYLKPVVISIHAKGLKGDFIFSNWTLAPGENLKIDPDTFTSDNPTVDGHIGWDEDNSNSGGYEQNTTSISVDYGEDTARVYERLIGFFEWNLGGLPDAIDVTDTVFKYHCTGRMQYGNIYEMSSQPSLSTPQTIYLDALEGTLYVSSASSTFPIVGTTKEIDLGASADSLIETRVAAERDWFAIGCCPPSFIDGLVTWIASENDGSANPKPTLYIVYTPIIEIITMIGGPTSYVWDALVPDVSIVRITTDNGKTWAWGVATSPNVVPDGGPTAWAWTAF